MDETPNLITGSAEARSLAAEMLREASELNRRSFPLLGKIEAGVIPGPPRQPGEQLISAIARDMGMNVPQLVKKAIWIINEGVLGSTGAGEAATHFRCWAALLVEAEKFLERGHMRVVQ